MEKYFNHYPNDDEKTILHYKYNIVLSESFYAVLSMFEVALRNSIQTAKRRIANRNETITANKVIAELTLGFWVRLLNAAYERIL